MAKYYWDRQAMKWVEQPPRDHSQPFNTPFIWGQIPDYQSPITGDVISGRSRRRDDLRAHGCREVAPDEFTPTLVNPKYKNNPKYDPDYSKEYYGKRAEAARGDGFNESRAAIHADPTASANFDS